MDAQNTNTETEKSPSQADAATEADSSEQDVVRLGPLPRLFDDAAMGRHDRLLGFAGHGLNLAFDASYAIGGMIDMLRANSIARDFDNEVLSPYQESCLMTAISALARGLDSSLEKAADHFEKELASTKGGV